MKRSHLFSYFLILLGASCWGSIGLFNRLLGADGVSMLNRVAVRNIGALLLLSVVFLLFRRQVFRIRLRHIPIFMASGIISVLGLAWFYFNCQMECSLAVAGILLYLAPSFVMIAGAVLWKSPFTCRKTIVLLLSLIGCCFVSGLIGNETVIPSPKGLLMGLFSALCYASYTIFAHYGLRYYDSLTMIYWTFVFAGLGSLLFLDLPDLASVLGNSASSLHILGLIVVATVLPYLLYTQGLDNADPCYASLLSNIEPVVAALIGVIAFGEKLDIWLILGIAFILFGTVILAMQRKNSPEIGR